MSKSVSYPVVVKDVREVTLRGRADLDQWAEVLRGEGLKAYQPAGQAELLMITADLTWMGFRFQELSISVLTSESVDGSTQDGAYLLRAFNSKRSFAFMERTMFKTPYYPAQVTIQTDPAVVRLSEDGRVVFNAQRCSDAPPTRRIDDVWEGPTYLPSKHVFYARLTGATDVFTVDPSDVFDLQPSAHSDLFQRLIETNFAIYEWHVRPVAIHYKSNTLKR